MRNRIGGTGAPYPFVIATHVPRGGIRTHDPVIDRHEAGDDRRECRRAEDDLVQLAAHDARIERHESREYRERLELNTQDQRRDGAREIPGVIGPFPSEQQNHVPRDACDEEHVHARGLCVHDELGQQRHGRGERKIPHGREEPAPRVEREQDQQNAAKRRRQTERPLGLAERLHGAGHHVELRDAARVVHAAREAAAGHPARCASSAWPSSLHRHAD